MKIPTAKVGKATLELMVLCSALLLSTGCSLLIGNVKPVEEKSQEYRAMDLPKVNPDWIKIDSRSDSGNTPASSTDASDLAYQSKKTDSIISLNSSCREVTSDQEKDLRELTRLLLLGISDISQRTEKEITVSGVPALETTIQGKLNGETMMLKTVVFNFKNCVYDMMYVALPEYFQSEEATFSSFISSLKLKT